MKKIQVGAGEHISGACLKAVRAGAPCFFNFNDVKVEHLDEKETARDLEAQWNTKWKAKCEAYRNSPAGKKAAEDSERRSRQNQARMDRLMGELPNFVAIVNAPPDHYAVLSWFEEFIDALDYIGVDCDKMKVAGTFLALGYRAGDNVGPHFKENNKDNVARYLVGQCLDGLLKKNGPFAGMIWPGAIGMIQDWKKRLGR
jgi:hypothetical protein